MKPYGSNNLFTAINNATLYSPSFRDYMAAYKAAKDDEQAVSKALLGPSKSNAYDIRPAAIDEDVDVASYTDALLMSEFDNLSDPLVDIFAPAVTATNTPQLRPLSPSIVYPA